MEGRCALGLALSTYCAALAPSLGMVVVLW